MRVLGDMVEKAVVPSVSLHFQREQEIFSLINVLGLCLVARTRGHEWKLRNGAERIPRQLGIIGGRRGGAGAERSCAAGIHRTQAVREQSLAAQTAWA